MSAGIADGGRMDAVGELPELALGARETAQPEHRLFEAGWRRSSLWPLTKCVVAVGIGVARPGSASAALGNAVVLRMNNMGTSQAEHRPDATSMSAG